MYPSIFRDKIIHITKFEKNAYIIFNYRRLIDSLHSYIAKVHSITSASSYAMNTPFGPISLDLVFPFKWLESELVGMFHVLMAFLNECVPFSTTSIVVSNASSVHIHLSNVANVQFN